MTGLVERLRIAASNTILQNDQRTMRDAADRITALEAQLQIVLDRESATTARYDAKLDALEAQVVAAVAELLAPFAAENPLPDCQCFGCRTANALAAFRAAKEE